MCPPAPVPPRANISACWTDEELVMLLMEIILGSPLPVNVLTDVNPYQYMPKNLPDDCWYFIRSEEKKDAELGFWKATGEACEIFMNSLITGWRTTLEFYEGQAPHGRKTDWVMQEYRITWRELCENTKTKESSLLCRVFLSDGRSLNHHQKQGGADSTGGNHFHSMPSVVPNADNTSGQGSISESQAKNGDDTTGPLIVAERLQNLPVENLTEEDYYLEGNFLEEDDLADPVSPFSNSDNSSSMSLSSEECFDSWALLQKLDDENNQDLQGKNAIKFSISASVKPNEVVVCPVTSGSLISGNGTKPPTKGTLKSDYSLPGSAIEGKFLDRRVPKDATKNQKVDHGREGISNSRNVVASSSSRKAVSEGEKIKALDGSMKKLMKYLCCMAV